MNKTGFTLATIALAAAARITSAAPAPECPSPATVQGFTTCADVKAAQAEGKLVIYSPDVEQGTAKLLRAFEEQFPAIKTQYVRLQTGALYAKLMAERQAGSHLVDVINLSDIGLLLDFQKGGGYAQYLSPQLGAYEPRFQSRPEGYFTWGAVIMGGIAYNPNTIKGDDVPKDWTDLNQTKWAGVVSTKSANSGLQYAAWVTLKTVFGEKYWKDVEKLRPRTFDSYVQQYDRLVNGEDKFAHTAQYSGVLEFQKKGAPLAFVAPASGLPASPEAWGIVKEAPNPQAARLFMDWFLSPVGQRVMADALYMHSARADVAPPANGIPLKDMKLLVPEDWDNYLRGRKEFVREWSNLGRAR